MWKPGDRVRMLRMAPDPNWPHPVEEPLVPSGAEGTVTGGCEQMKALYVKWDDGSTLSICTDADLFERA